MNNVDPWSQTVSWLRRRASDKAGRSGEPTGWALREYCYPAPAAMAEVSPIIHIEWQTTSTIRVSWSDSTRGRYLDQTWRAGFASTAGICRLTGLPVRRGDAVFRPLVRVGIAPINSRDMILADTLLREEQGGVG